MNLKLYSCQKVFEYLTRLIVSLTLLAVSSIVNIYNIKLYL